VANIGMNKEEFEYLSRKAVLTFEQTANWLSSGLVLPLLLFFKLQYFISGLQ
jgi:hypothetical protein